MQPKAAGTPDSEPRPEKAVPGRETPAAGSSEADVAHADQVSGDEPLLAARVHRPSDLMRLLIGILAIAVVLAVAAFAQGTTSGLEQDINKGTGQAPDLLVKIAGLASSIAVLLVPVAFAIERLIKRDGLRIADGVLAAVLAHGVTLATDLWVAKSAPGSLQDALTQQQTGGELTDPVHGYLAPVIAYMTAVGMARRPRWRVVLWMVLMLDAFAMLVAGYTTPFSVLLTVLLGWTVAYGTLYAVGSPNVRPTGQNLLAGLRHVGFRPVTAMRAEDDAPESADQDRGRRYLVSLEDGPPLDVTVVDREQQAQGFFYRVWRRLTLRSITTRRSIQSLRQALEQEALLAYAAIAAGANAPKLIATSELGPDAVMLVYEHSGGRSLDSLADDEITDDVVRGAWRQVKALQSRRIAHRRLAGGRHPGRPRRPGDHHGSARRRDRRRRHGAPDGHRPVADHPGAAGGRRTGRGRGGRRARPRQGRRLPAAPPADRPEPLDPGHPAPSGTRAGPARAGRGAGGVGGGEAGPYGGGLRRRPQGGPQGGARGEAGGQARHGRSHGRGAGGGPALPDPPSGAADQAAGSGGAGPSGADQAPHARQLHRRCGRRVLPAVADRRHRLRHRLRERPLGLGGGGPAVLRAQLRGGGDEPVGVRPRTGRFPADGDGAGRRVVRQDRRPCRGRRRGPEHPVPPALRGPAGSRRGQCRRLAAVRARRAHPAAAVLRLPDRHGEDGVAHPVQDGDRRSADGRRTGPGGDGDPVPAEVRRDPAAVAVRRRRAAHAGRAPEAGEADHRHRRDAAADGSFRALSGRVGPGVRRRPPAGELREHRRGVPRRQRTGLGGADAGRCGRRRGRAAGRSGAGGRAEGGRRARCAAVPDDDAVAAGPTGLVRLHAPHPQGLPLTVRGRPDARCRTAGISPVRRSAAASTRMDRSPVRGTRWRRTMAACR
ncbi:integral membrane protein [Streptomyces pristinaespiralis ATCC 25486]|uniref:Integral membrane protein n=1 Tax=Streptomyces pristinaespiralis (strain ATCC 25486 / DSM 40338 / CBS 914.69 / JCM 4507 / KCC S-0507 / NBRC 13074 / NRRL 2958 / 5647) TaxID=457429 RepID=D6X6P3_STRE2|nr:integral membrane protein [Streptomyces pristinaespiralis ATCC 25486]